MENSKMIYRSAKKIDMNLEERKEVGERLLETIAEDQRKNLKIGVNDYFYDSEIMENTILIQGLGVNVRGNMQYILNELNSNDLYSKFKIYVRTNDSTDAIVKGYIEQNHWTRTETVPKNYSKYLESCQYMITESYFAYNWVKKPGQVVIDLWHGTPLKCIGLYKNGKSCHVNGIQQKNFLCSDYLLYPNDYTEDKMLLSYRIKSLLPGKAMMLGYPRTGGLLAVSKERQEEIKKILAPNGEKIYAYMPTWKGYLSNDEVVAQSRNLLNYLDENLRDDQILYVNLHHKVSDSMDYSGFKHIKKFPPLVDSYELMTTTEALISDYSSVFFDYLVLGKQIILDLEDYQAYLKHQGLYIDIEELPFDKAYSKEAILEALNRGKSYDDTEIMDSFCKNDSAFNSKKLCKIMVKDESELSLHEHPKNDKKKVLVFSHNFLDDKATDLMEQFTTEYDKERFEVYLSCDREAVDENKSASRAYPILYDNLAIGYSNSDEWFSTAGSIAKRKVLNNEMTFAEAFDILKYDYAVISKRAYGYTKFDAIYIYDVENADTMMGLALADSDRKCLFLNDTIFAKIESGDTYFHNAVRYAADICNNVFVFSALQKQTAVKLLGEDWANKITVIEGTGDLHKMLDALEDQVVFQPTKTYMPEDVCDLAAREDGIVKSGKTAIRSNLPLAPMFKQKFMAHALGGINGKAYLNSEAGLKQSLEKGYLFVEADILMTEDGKIVCAHGWEKADCEKVGMKYKPEFAHMTEELFLKQTLADGLPVMDAKKLYQYMTQNPNMYLQLDLHKITPEETKKELRQVLELFKHDAKVLNRLLIQVGNNKMFMAAKEVYPFKYFQYVLVENIQRLDEIIPFCVQNGISSIAIKKKYTNAERVKKIKDAGLALLSYTVNDIEEAKALFALGVDTVCTDSLAPDSIYSADRLTLVYNSTAGASENLSELLEKNILHGNLKKVKSGSYEYDETISVVKGNKYGVMACCFAKSGKEFVGWNLRCRAKKDDEWEFYCTDGNWHTKSTIEEDDSLEKLMVLDREKVDFAALMKYNKIILEAVWA